MFSPIHRDSGTPRPRRGINAEVLVDGFSPAAAKTLFQIDRRQQLVADYLLRGDRGFMRLIPLPQFPTPEFITLKSQPVTLDQYRVAFGLTLLTDVQELNGKMGINLHFSSRSAGRFITASEPAACIRFLEIIEGVDDFLVRFRYRNSGAVVKGSISL